MRELAVYLTPPAADPLYRLATQFLGYDLWKGQPCEQCSLDGFSVADSREFVGGAARFGFHLTIGDALVYQETDYIEICERLTWLATRIQPFTLAGPSLFTDFWAADMALVINFAESPPELLVLADKVATLMNPLYQGSPYYPAIFERFPHLIDDLHESWERYFHQYGAPTVRDYFSPHMTFASGKISGEQGVAAQKWLNNEMAFLREQRYSWSVDSFLLVEKDSEGWFQVLETFSLNDFSRA